VLVYSTCTLVREENEAVVEGFLAESPWLRVAPPGAPALAPLVGEDGFLRTFPHRHDADGFFAARLERTS
jgi:16S rRNA (cytosine967-C5)-methyltransferase